MAIIALLIFAVLSLLGRMPQWEAASFDLDDPEAARDRYAELGDIDGWAARGRAWCALAPAEVRAIAKHTAMSNIITTTIRTSSDGETATSVVIEAAANQGELVGRWAGRVADECRYNVWDNLERLDDAADDAERAEVFCSLGADEAARLLRFLSEGLIGESSKYVSDTGESTEIIIERPPEAADETAIADAIASAATRCGGDRR